jgi:nitroreductase
MEFLELIKTRRTVRGFSGAPVARETLEGLLAAAVEAPTGMNLQPWAFGVIEGVDRLRAYSDRAKAYLLANLEQFPMFARYREMLENPEVNLCYNASACIVVYAKPGGATPDADCTMAAYNIMLAAANEGLGSCWVGFLTFTLNDPATKAELGVPADYRVVAPLVVGTPAAPPAPVTKHAPEIVFWQQ